MRRVFGAVVAIVIAVSIDARADEPKGLGETLSGEARALYDIGRTSFQAGDAESARQEEAGAVEQGRRGAAEAELNAVMLIHGVTLSDQETADAVRLVMGGMDPEDAMAEVLERAAIQTVDEAVADAPPASAMERASA